MILTMRTIYNDDNDSRNSDSHTRLRLTKLMIMMMMMMVMMMMMTPCFLARYNKNYIVMLMITYLSCTLLLSNFR